VTVAPNVIRPNSLAELLEGYRERTQVTVPTLGGGSLKDVRYRGEPLSLLRITG
jgi:hypothetical protein